MATNHAYSYSAYRTDLDNVLKQQTDHVFFRNRRHTPPTPPSTAQDNLLIALAPNRLHPKVNPGSRCKVRTKKGALSLFMEMPVDIIYEVFQHLHPMDVLTLSRTCRSLRSMLLEPHARTAVWGASLNGSLYTPPPCPPDIHERMYVSLVFDNWCQSCYALDVEQVSWLCRVRYCDDCIRKYFIPEEDLRRWIPTDIYIEKLATVFPYAVLLNPQQHDLPQASSLTNNNNNNVNQNQAHRSKLKPLYHFPTIRTYLAELDVIAAQKDENALLKWSKEKKEIMNARVRHAIFTSYWTKNCAYRQSLWGSLPSKTSEVVVLVLILLALVALWWDWLEGKVGVVLGWWVL